MADGSRVVVVTRSFIVHSGSVLVVKRSADRKHNASLWEAPGGKLDDGQCLQESLKREISEETGLLTRPVDDTVAFDSRIMDGKGRYRGMTYVVLFGISYIIGGELKLSNEHCAYEWCTYADLTRLTLTPETRKATLSSEIRLKKAGVR